MSSPPLPSWPPCVLLHCPNAGEFEFNRRLLCATHFEQLSRTSVAAPAAPPAAFASSVRAKCAFPGCKKPGLSPHGRDVFCRRHLTPVLLLDAHVDGQFQPVRYRHTRRQIVRLCQVGPCQGQGKLLHGDALVCKAHAVLLAEKDRFVDRDKAAEYALDQSSHELASRTSVCNFVGCNAGHVTHKYHGAFCAEHLPVIDDLRSRIMTAKCHGDEAVQIPLRYSEIFLRKFLDERHVQYYNELVAKHGGAAPTVHVRGGQVVGLSSGLSRLAH
ncbi:uncharacterized protein IUM83_02598 [Phytophthora cinnamomi]|uniref:uncharacterized protein n=1 Tax=Phytophthora cinnamomi TaxID=4785 RepID=UPI00355A47A6|nr:hypothetical protein IUM83_02598 [Phytophthora cinnamomi]